MVYEDFTTYTEVDVAADRIQRTANHVDHKAYRNESTYLYKDKGANFFGNFTHRLEATSDFATASCWGVVWMLANSVKNLKAVVSAYETAVALFFYRLATYYELRLYETYGGVEFWDDSVALSANTKYYLTVKKNNTSFSCEIRTGSHTGTLVDTLALTLQANHTFRYIYACNTYNDNTTPYCNDDIDNLDLAPVLGWSHKISGVTNPAKVMGVPVANIAKVKGVA
jgi:hypothetical protein